MITLQNGNSRWFNSDFVKKAMRKATLNSTAPYGYFVKGEEASIVITFHGTQIVDTASPFVSSIRKHGKRYFKICESRAKFQVDI